jgi:hypothetical protein
VNWNQIQTLFDGQGIVFWTALVAVALGLTLLSVSIFIQVRKMVGSRIFLRRKMTTQAPVACPVATATPPITVTGDVYEATGFVPAATTGAPASAPAADPRLANLLQRLKSSADRLDRIHGSLGRNAGLTATTTDSPLKATSEEVDYVYRTGRA